MNNLEIISETITAILARFFRLLIWYEFKVFMSFNQMLVALWGRFQPKETFRAGRTANQIEKLLLLTESLRTEWQDFLISASCFSVFFQWSFPVFMRANYFSLTRQKRWMEALLNPHRAARKLQKIKWTSMKQERCKRY